MLNSYKILSLLKCRLLFIKPLIFFSLFAFSSKVFCQNKIASGDSSMVIYNRVQKQIDSIENKMAQLSEEIEHHSIIKNGYTRQAKQTLRIFTNAKGLDKDEVPGFLQLDGQFSWPFIGKYIGPFFGAPKTYCMLFDNLVVPDIQILRFDPSKFYVAPLYTIPDSVRNDTIFGGFKNKYINHFDLFQYSYLRMFNKVNILTVKFRRSIFRIDGSLSFFRSRVTDTDTTPVTISKINLDSIPRRDVPIHAAGYGLSFFWKTQEIKSDFNVTLRAGFHWLNLMSGRYDFIGNVREDTLYSNRKILIDSYESALTDSKWKVAPIQIYSMEIKYKDVSWIRFTFNNNAFRNNLLKNKAVSTLYNNYFQMQIGVDTNFEKIIALFKPESPDIDQYKK